MLSAAEKCPGLPTVSGLRESSLRSRWEVRVSKGKSRTPMEAEERKWGGEGGLCPGSSLPPSPPRDCHPVAIYGLPCSCPLTGFVCQSRLLSLTQGSRPSLQGEAELSRQGLVRLWVQASLMGRELVFSKRLCTPRLKSPTRLHPVIEPSPCFPHLCSTYYPGVYTEYDFIGGLSSPSRM